MFLRKKFHHIHQNRPVTRQVEDWWSYWKSVEDGV